MAKKELVNKVAGFLAGTALGLLPILASGQSLKEDINWTKEKAPYQKYNLLIRSIYPLSGLSKYESAPSKNYLPHGNLNLGYNHNYFVPQDSIKGDVLKYLKKIDVCPECTNYNQSSVTKKTTSKPTPVKKPVPVKKKTPKEPIITPTPSQKNKTNGEFEDIKNKYQDLEDKYNYLSKQDSLNKLKKEESQVTNYNITNINNTTNITNNYYGDTAKVKEAQQKLSSLEIRAIINAGKVINPLESPFYNFSLNPQLYNSSVGIGFGPYVEVGIGKEKEVRITDFENEELINQASQLFTGTKGTRKEILERCFPIEWGAILSTGTKNNKFRFDFGYGLVREDNSTSGISEFGVDYIRKGENIINQKDYGPIEKEKGKNLQTWKQTQQVGIAVSPFNNGTLGLKGRVKHIGKPGSEDGFFSYEVGLTSTIGGGKHRK